MKMKFCCAMIVIAFATQQIKGQSSTLVLTATPSISVSHPSYNVSHNMTSSVNVSNTSTTTPTTIYEERSTERPSIYHTTSTTNIMPTPASSRMASTSSSISVNNNTQYNDPTPTVKPDDMEGKITLYLLIACVCLFIIIIIILITLVLQMKRLTNKLRR